MTPTIDCIIDITNGRKTGLLVNLYSQGLSNLPLVFDTDTQLIRVRAARPHTADQSALWDLIDLTAAGTVVECAIGVAEQPPSSGTWALSYEAVNTGLTALAINQSAASLQTALTAITSTAGDGNVVVTQIGTGAYLVTFQTSGARSLLAGDGTSLSPESSVNVTRLVTGDPDTNEVQLIRILQSPVAYTDVFVSDAVDAANSMIGTMNLSTIPMAELFAATTADIVSLFFSIRITFPGQAPLTVLRIPVSIARAVINPESLIPLAFPTAVIQKSNFLSKVLANAADSGSVDFSGLGLSGPPQKVIALSVSKHAAGDSNIVASFIEGSQTSTAATYELDGPTDNANRTLHYLVIP